MNFPCPVEPVKGDRIFRHRQTNLESTHEGTSGEGAEGSMVMQCFCQHSLETFALDDTVAL